MAALIFSAVQMMGAGVSAFGQYTGGRAAKSAADYNAAVTMAETREKEQASEAKFSRLKGEQRALFAKAGVDISSGSPLLVLMDTAMQEKEEQERILFSGQSEAAMQKWQGRQAAYEGTSLAGTTWVTGLGRAGLGYLKYQKGIG